MTLPSSPACERNREPILTLLRSWFADRHQVLEIGSGTGEHAAYFAAHLPHLRWQGSDRGDYLPVVRARLAQAGLANAPPPLLLDVNGEWPAGPFDAVFTANTLHIMAWSEVESLFERLGQVTTADARLVVYGPFHDNGRATSQSNADFDASLRARAGHMGLRDAQAVGALAARAGFVLCAQVPMQANNQCLLWRREPPGATETIAHT